MIDAAALRKTLARRVLGRVSWRRQRTVVAVEWSGEWLKLAQVTATANERRLTRLEAAQVPSPEALPGTLQDLLAGAETPADAVIISMPRNLVTVRNLRLPSTDPVELEEMAGLQAASLTPYAKDEIITSFETVAEATQAGETDIIIGIANREVSYQRLKVLEDIQLKARGIQLSSDGVVQWQSLGPASDGPVAVVDVDTYFTDFVVALNRQLIFTKMMPIGASKLAGGEEPWLRQFLEEMKTALDLYEREGAGGPITKMIVTGVEVDVAGLLPRLREGFGLAVERVTALDWIPEAREALGESQAQNHLKTVSFASVIGLAWNPGGARIDLTPLEVSQREGLAKRGRDLAVMGILLISILAVLSGLVSARLYVKRQYLEQLRHEVQRTRDRADQVEKLRKETRAIKELLKAKSASLEILSQLHRLLPPQISLTTVTFKAGDSLTFKGTAGEMSRVFEFVSVLEKERAFSQVKVRQVAARGTEENKQQAEFEIACALRSPNDEDQRVAF